MVAFVLRRDSVEVETFPGVRRRVLACGSNMLLTENTYLRGSEVPRHVHDDLEQVNYIVVGKVLVGIGDKEYLFNSGDSYIVPKGVIHWLKALEDAVAVEVFSPPHPVFSKDLERVARSVVPGRCTKA